MTVKGSTTKVSYPVYAVAFTPGAPRLLVGGGGGANNNNGVPNGINGYKVSAAKNKEYSVEPYLEKIFPKGSDTCMALAVNPKEKIIAVGVVAPDSDGADESATQSSPSKSLNILRSRKSKSLGKHNVAVLEFKKIDGKDSLQQSLELSTGENIDTESHYIKRLCFSDDGTLLLAACANGTAVVYRYENGQFIERPFQRVLKEEIQDADLNPHHHMVALCTADYLRVCAIEGGKGKLSCNIEIAAPVYKNSISCSFRACRFLPINATGNSRDSLVFTSKLLVFLNSSLKSGPKRSHVMCFLIQQQADSAGELQCVAQEYRTSRQLSHQLVSSAAVNAATGTFAVAYSDFSLGVYMTDSWYTCIWKMPRAHTFVITSLSFHSDGGLLASGSADGSFAVWNVESARRGSYLKWLIRAFILIGTLFFVAIALILSNENWTIKANHFAEQFLQSVHDNLKPYLSSEL